MPYSTKEKKNENARKWYLENRDRLSRSAASRAQGLRDSWRSTCDQLMCVDCGRVGGLLDFHHRDPGTKFENVCDMVYGARVRLIEEVEKCDVLCRKCHKHRHSIQKRS